MTGPNRALIELQALRHNLQHARRAVGTARIMAVIKSNAYGHGVEAVATALADADAFAVARVDEAIPLRNLGCRKPIVVLGGVLDADELKLCVDQNLQPVVHHAFQVQLLRQHLPESADCSVWLKLNTGMNRLGINPDQAGSTFNALHAIPGVSNVHWMTHFACADDVSERMTESQIQCFQGVTSDQPGWKSLANSAALLAHADAQADWVRPGIMLYGASPFIGRVSADDDLQPVMTLQSQVIALREVAEGESVGYGRTWQAGRPTTVAVVGIGYGDGYPRQASTGTPVWIRGQRVQLIGRVSMDSITVDVSDVPAVEVGDVVELWGRNLPAETVAQHCGTIAYHLFCGVTARVPRVYIG